MIIQESPANTIFYCSLNEPSGILWRAQKVLLFRSLNRSRCVKLCLFCVFNLRFEFKGPVASLLYILSFLYVAQSHEDSFSCDVSGELSTSYREKLHVLTLSVCVRFVLFVSDYIIPLQVSKFYLKSNVIFRWLQRWSSFLQPDNEQSVHSEACSCICRYGGEPSWRIHWRKIVGLQRYERSFSRLYTGLLRSVAFAHILLLCFYRKISGFVLLSPRFVSTTYRILCLN